MIAKATEVEKAVEGLAGVLMGISIDNVINELEVEHLIEWLDNYKNFHSIQPFTTVIVALERILADGSIDEEEKEEILDLCHMFDTHGLICDFATTAIRRLHGVLQGIAIDGHIREQEAMGLKGWLSVHETVRKYWPFCELWEMLSKMLEDFILHDQERAELMEYCNNFKECKIDNPVIHDEIYEQEFMTYYSAILQPFTALCDRQAEIEFKGKCFCFTGPAKSGARKMLHQTVEMLNGIPKSNVSSGLDYLVIGAQSSPAWAYATYGRKIEAAIHLNMKGSEITILHEDDFIRQSKIHQEIHTAKG